MSIRFEKNGEFAEQVLPSSLLDSVVWWVRRNLDPDDVFSDDQLSRWVRRNCPIDEVFDQSELDAWAKENGYRKDDE